LSTMLDFPHPLFILYSSSSRLMSKLSSQHSPTQNHAAMAKSRKKHTTQVWLLVMDCSTPCVCVCAATGTVSSMYSVCVCQLLHSPMYTRYYRYCEKSMSCTDSLLDSFSNFFLSLSSLSLLSLSLSAGRKVAHPLTSGIRIAHTNQFLIAPTKLDPSTVPPPPRSPHAT
jgi:hypothetical protein